MRFRSQPAPRLEEIVDVLVDIDELGVVPDRAVGPRAGIVRHRDPGNRRGRHLGQFLPCLSEEVFE